MGRGEHGRHETQRTTGYDGTTAWTHPLWLLGLASLLLAMHPSLRGSQPLHAIGGAASLLVAPAAVCLLLRARGRAAVLAVHLVLAQLFIGSQLAAPLSALLPAVGTSTGLSWAVAPGPWQLLNLLGLLASYAWLPLRSQQAGGRHGAAPTGLQRILPTELVY